MQPLARAETRVDDLDICAGTQAACSHQRLGKRDDLDRLAHVQHVNVAWLGHRQRPDDQGDRLAEELDYVPMPDPVVRLIQTNWKSQLKDSSGNPVY